MKSIIFNLNCLPVSYLAYIIYLIHQVQKQYKDAEFWCYCSDAMKLKLEQELSLKFCNSFLFNKLNHTADTYVEWKPFATSVWRKKKYSQKLHVCIGAKNSNDLKNNRCLIELLKNVMKILDIKPEPFYYYWRHQKKSIALKKIMNKYMGENKRIIYIDLVSESHNYYITFYFELLKKFLETQSLTLLVRTEDKAVMIKHPDCIFISPELSLNDNIHLIKSSDIYCGVSEGLNHVAACLGKAIFLIASPQDRLNKSVVGMNARYFEVFLLKNSSLKNSELIKKQVKLCFNLFSDLLYDLNLNQKLSIEEFNQKIFLMHYPTGVVFNSSAEQEKWCDINRKTAHLIEPLIATSWAYLKIRMQFIEKKSIQCLIGNISLIQQLITSIVVFMKYRRKLIWLRQAVNAYLPFNLWLATAVKAHNEN